jgi:TRAP transporter TAXI family solute receptor
VENIRRVESGESTFGLAETDVAYAAFHGEGPFAAAGPDPKLRMLIALYPEEFTVITRADTGIQNFQDLRGRSVGIGMTGAGFTFTRDAILGYYGWTISDADRLLELGPAEQNGALCSHKVDAIIFSAGHPDGLTQDATFACGARLVPVAGPPIATLLAAHPYYVASVIRGGMYAGNPDDIPTIGTRAVLITSSDQPDALARAVVQAVFENFADFQRLHPALLALNLKDMVPSEAVVPIHPGALAYFRETGLAR